MNIIVDENIAFAEEAFSQFGNVTLIDGRKISNSILKNCDILIVRSITKVSETLLNETKVKFVGTATIGTDHIDFDYLGKNNIAFADAKGCNSYAVTEYVFTALAKAVVEKQMVLKDKSIGVVGVGNIGSKIVKLAETLGMKIMKNDPPVQRETGSTDFVPLENIYDADIITLHVPLNREGIDKTVHLFDGNNLKKLKEDVIFINASRGPVVDNKALLEMLRKQETTCILDVWEDEPEINLELLKKAFIGSPHIAGYSLEGKVNGTVTMVDAVSKYLNVKSKWSPDLPAIDNSIFTLDKNESFEKTLFNIFTSIYPVDDDDRRMRDLLLKDEAERPGYFDRLRKNYPLRREFSNYTIEIEDKNYSGEMYKKLQNVLKAFRFRLREK